MEKKFLNVTFDAAPSARSIDANGFMHVVSSHITKAQVVPYWGREIPGWEERGLRPDRLYYGYRPADELEKSLQTWNGLPLHVEHHVDGADEPQKLSRVGAMGTNSEWNFPYVDNALVIWDKDAQQGINDGTFREISCAYRYTPDFTPGEYDGIPYDFVMRNIEGNHVALVESGRAGRDVVVADSDTTQGAENMAQNMTEPGIPAGGSPRLAAIIDELTQVKAALEQKEADALAALADKIEKKEGKDMTGEVIEEKKDVIETPAAPVEPTTDAPVAPAVPANDPAPTEPAPTADAPVAPAAPAEPAPAEPKGEDDEAKMDAFVETLSAELAAKLMEKLAAKFPPAKDEPVAPVAPAMDADTIKAEFKELFNATRVVRPICGEVDPFAFDSAASIYGEALTRMGLKLDGHDKSAYRSMFEAAMSQRVRNVAAPMAMDMRSTEYSGAFSGLKKISIGA